jgi:hypothetical protein
MNEREELIQELLEAKSTVLEFTHPQFSDYYPEHNLIFNAIEHAIDYLVGAKEDLEVDV